jgi:hypothetical protein
MAGGEQLVDFATQPVRWVILAWTRASVPS